MSGNTKPDPAGGKEELPAPVTETVSGGGLMDITGCTPDPWKDSFPPPDDMRDPNPILS